VRRTRLVTAVAGLALAGGCAAGPPSDYLRPQGDGATGQVGDVVVTNALLDAGAGATGLHATIVNQGGTPDRLLAVASPVAGGGEAVGDPTVPARGALSTGYAASATPPPGTAPVTLRLTGLTEAVRPGRTYPVDLTFARAGVLRLDVPVAGPDDPAPS
jgi:hypothetical protein